jgi:hypothetical protein
MWQSPCHYRGLPESDFTSIQRASLVIIMHDRTTFSFGNVSLPLEGGDRGADHPLKISDLFERAAFVISR